MPRIRKSAQSNAQAQVGMLKLAARRMPARKARDSQSKGMIGRPGFESKRLVNKTQLTQALGVELMPLYYKILGRMSKNQAGEVIPSIKVCHLF